MYQLANAWVRLRSRQRRQQLTLSANNWTLGFEWFRRRLSARIASLAETDLDRTWSHISRFRAMSTEPDGSKSDVALSDNNVSSELCPGCLTLAYGIVEL